MSLLDDALRAVTATSATLPGPMPVAGNTFDASVTTAGAHAAFTRSFAKTWSASAWADATWSGNRAAGISVKGTF